MQMKIKKKILQYIKVQLKSESNFTLFNFVNLFKIFKEIDNCQIQRIHDVEQ